MNRLAWGIFAVVCLVACGDDESVAGATSGGGGLGGEGTAPPCSADPNETNLLQNSSFEAFDGAAFPAWTATGPASQSTSRLDGLYSVELTAQGAVRQTVTTTIPSGSTVRACAYSQRVDGTTPPSLGLTLRYAGSEEVGTFVPPLFDATWSRSAGNLTATAEVTAVDISVAANAGMPSPFRVDAAALIVLPP
jgi:hypothetical protein